MRANSVDRNVNPQIDRAKSLLIEREGLSENDAHYRLQKEAMNRRVSKLQVAQEILRYYDENAD